MVDSLSLGHVSREVPLEEVGLGQNPALAVSSVLQEVSDVETLFLQLQPNPFPTQSLPVVLSDVVLEVTVAALFQVFLYLDLLLSVLHHRLVADALELELSRPFQLHQLPGMFPVKLQEAADSLLSLEDEETDQVLLPHQVASDECLECDDLLVTTLQFVDRVLVELHSLRDFAVVDDAFISHL